MIIGMNEPEEGHERDLIPQMIESLRERAEELEPAYNEYLQLCEAVRSLETIHSSPLPSARPRRGRPAGKSHLGRPTLERMILEALGALGGDHHDAREICVKIGEAHGPVKYESVSDKVQKMATTGEVDRPLRGRYRLWAEES